MAKDGEISLSISEVFSEVARLQPGEKAIAGGDWEPTYAELERAASRIAQVLHRDAGNKGDRVALLLHHDALQVAACLAVLKVGRIVVVLNATDPPSRLNEIIADASPTCLITTASLRELAEPTGFPPSRILLAEVEDDSPLEPMPDTPADFTEVAFLVYTSGSTGKPKGVMQTHESIIHNAWRLALGLGITPQDRIILLGSLSGGQGVGTAWTALLNGATLCPFPIMDRGVTGLAEWMRQQEVSIYVSSASTFRHFMQTLAPGDQFARVRVVRLASEHALDSDHSYFRKHFPPTCRLAPTFSLSETGNLTQGHLRVDDRPAPGRLPVGKPSPGVTILLLDQQGHIAPPGEAGEVVVHCRQISRGYWRNDALTQERYRPDPSNPTLRRFHTGDIGRWNTRGELVLEGRRDAQIKIRGYRIEIGAIEKALQQVPAVAEVVVLPLEADNNPKLAAFLTASQGARLERAQVRANLREKLPAYMVPSEIFILDEIPLTAHGKADRAGLLKLASQTPLTGAGGDPRNELEEVLAGIWAEVFNLEIIGREDDFFDLGGDSLIAAVVSACVSDRLHLKLDLNAFVLHPTVAAMAVHIEGCRIQGTSGGGTASAPVIRQEEPVEILSHHEERLWTFFKDPATENAYNMAAINEIRGPLDVEAFRESVNRVLERHDVFRTSYTRTETGGGLRTLREFRPIEIPLHDLSGDAVPMDKVNAARLALCAEPFDFANGPLVRMQLFKFGPEDFRLVRVHTHLISDGWSWKVFYQDFVRCYAAIVEGRPHTPKPPSLRYADFAAWQRQHMASDAALYQEQLAWWKEKLAGAPEPVKLPWRREVPSSGTPPTDGFVQWGIPQKVSLALDRLGRAEQSTYYATRLAAFASTVGHATGQRDFVIGSYATNRQRLEFQEIFGFFANLVTFRFQYDPQITFRSWLVSVRNLVAEVHARADLPYEQLCNELRQTGVTPPEVRLIYTVSARLPPMTVSGLEILQVRMGFHGMPWGTSVQFHRWTEEQECELTFDANTFDREEMILFIRDYQAMLASFAEHPDVPMLQLHEQHAKAKTAAPISLKS